MSPPLNEIIVSFACAYVNTFHNILLQTTSTIPTHLPTPRKGGLQGATLQTP